jgi:hypothetical protein
VALALAHRRHVADPSSRHQKTWLGIALPERPEAGELVGHPVSQALAADHRVNALAS